MQVISTKPRLRGRPGTSWVLLGVVAALGLLARSSQVHGQAQLASISGIVTAEETGKPLSSVTVVINGPALQEFQSEVTDANGRYIITQLPPGDDYQVAFYFGADDKPKVVRPGIRLSLGKNVTVSVPVKLTSGKREVKVIRESAPNVDTASASTGVELNQELLRNTPVRGRTFESVIALAPGASDVAPRVFSATGGGPQAGGEVGVSVGGSTGAENNYIVDGINTTDPNLGLVGMELSQYFIKEINIITGGSQAEYGRATGGVVTIATKSGGNEFHGSVFGSIQPYQLTPQTVARLGEAIGTRTKTQALFDVGFDLGGYIVKDRIWFYVGFAPTITMDQVQRRFRSLSQDPATGMARLDPDYQCPSYLRTSQYCLGPSRFALLTNEIDGSGSDIPRTKRLYNAIAKVQFNINPDHNITLGLIASPTQYDDTANTGYYNTDSQRYTRLDQVYDASARYLGKFINRKLQLDVQYGFHYQGLEEKPQQNGSINDQTIVWNADPASPFSLSDFESATGCARVGAFNPCPLTKYTDGFGLYRQQTLQRHMLLASATAYAHFTDKWNPLRGIHAVKLGFDFEQIFTDSARAYSGSDLDPADPTQGHRVYQVLPGLGSQITREFGQRGLSNCANPQPGDPDFCFLNRFRGFTQTRNFAVYLRDSWQVDWAPGLVVNLGVRWEGQEIFGMDLKSDPLNPQLGDKVISIYDNWAPRVGLAYDFTQLTDRPGRGKIFFNYGRFYQSVPTDINDRQFTGEGIYSSGFAGCPVSPSGVSPRDRSCNYPAGIGSGGQYGAVTPSLKGQYINEIILGLNYDVGLDVVLGISYIHRNLGNVIEDVSPDLSNYLVANPGLVPDPNLEKDLMAAVDNATNDADRAKAQGKLDSYKLQQQIGAIFPKAVRNYNALQLTMQKRFSNRFSLIASYTYSRTIGNYPGTFSPSNGQLDPNISTQFDIIDLLANRNGPLPGDRPHNFKATGFYEQPIGDKAKLNFGLTFTATSGRPIEVLGTHLYYGPNEVYILPRGSGGRTPTVTQLDLHIGYEQKLGQRVSLSLFGDVINLVNQRTPTNVDDVYTYDVVQAIRNGQPEDLKHLRTQNGALPAFNSNYGQPTAYQMPLTFRLGGRLSF
jgi:hypothetical protein